MNSTPTYPPPGHEHPPGPPPPFQPGSGPCGLTTHEWHGFLIFILLLLFVFLIAVVVAWNESKDVSELWLRAKLHVGTTRKAWREELLKGVLPQHDIRNGLIAPPRPGLGAQSRSTVNVILAALFPSMRHRPGP